MSYKVSIEAFEGPFDLLLQLVNRQKIDIGAISIAQIADQYLDELAQVKNFDLDVASDFLVVAATLLQLKADALIPEEEHSQDADDEFASLTLEQTREILITRLITYKQFKNAAASLRRRQQNEAKMHARNAGLEPQFLNLVPDYLKDVTLDELGYAAAALAVARDTFLLEAKHIAAVPISMENHVEGIYHAMRKKTKQSFVQLLGKAPSPELIVVTFMAVLELYKRGVISMEQKTAFADIALTLEKDAPEITDFSVPDWGAPEDESLTNNPKEGLVLNT